MQIFKVKTTKQQLKIGLTKENIDDILYLNINKLQLLPD